MAGGQSWDVPVAPTVLARVRGAGARARAGRRLLLVDVVDLVVTDVVVAGTGRGGGPPGGAPRVRSQPREQELRRHLRRRLEGAVPVEDADLAGRAAQAVLRDRAPQPAELPRADQWPGAQPRHPGRLHDVHRVRADRRRGAAAGGRPRLRLPVVGDDDRGPAGDAEAELARLPRGHGHAVPSPGHRVARRHEQGPRRGPVRHQAQPVRLLPQHRRLAELSARRRRPVPPAGRPGQQVDHPEPLVHHPEPLQRRS